MKNQDQYWAALPPDECATEVWSRKDEYQKSIKSSTLYPRWVRGFRMFHGLADNGSGDSSRLSRLGSKAHRAGVRSGRLAVDARHQLSIIAPLIPALDAIPVNTAYKTLAQVREGKRFFDYYVERRGLGKMLYQTAENMQKFGVAWLLTDWDPFAGQPMPQGEPPADLAQPQPAEVPEGPPKQETTGDVVFSAHTPLTCVVDVNQDGEHDWYIVRTKFSRWELRARYPSQATEIANAPSIVDDEKWMGNDFKFDGLQKSTDTDLVAGWTLLHRKNRSLPAGRMLLVLTAQTWLFDGPLPYEEVPIAEMNAGKIWNTPFGDSTLHHASGIQQASDRALSATVTNVLALGHQLVSIQDENFDLQELSDGVSAIINKPGPGGEPPRGVSLMSSQAEHHRTIDYLDRAIDSTMGTNSVIRGEPEANVKSGAYAGLLVQQATQYNSPAQFSFQRCTEKVGNDLLGVLKRFAKAPVLGEISGPNGQWRMREFTQEDYSGIHRLVAKPGNPAEQTAVFKKQKADQLLEAGLITSKQEYESMCETNSSELGTEDDEAEELNVLRENEMMQALAEGRQTEDTSSAVPWSPPPPPSQLGPDGAPLPAPPPPQPIMIPPVLQTDNDALHVRKHANLLNSPAARGNQQLVLIVGAHCAAHIENSADKPPELAAMLGQPPPPPPPGAMPPAPPEKGPAGVQKVRPIKPPPEATAPPGPVAP